MPPTLSLLRRSHPLAVPERQRSLLEPNGLFPPFASTLQARGMGRLRADGVRVLQINVGKTCNQTCRHCHVDAGPDRREQMDRATMRACLNAVAGSRIPVVDITGGAPEMNPNFRWLVAESRALGAHVIDRCNLTILLVPGFEDLAEFLAQHRVEVVASLPCYLADNTDAQRGAGVFDRSITAMRRLNALGYGEPGAGLDLTLVYNPIGASLPPNQSSLEAAYRRELETRFGVRFTRLYTITNMPISRFLEDLVRQGQFETYMRTLIDAFNPSAVAGLMCRGTVSVGWDGTLYDCDFNQMLELPLTPPAPRHIRDFNQAQLENRPIVTHQHCYGCTAGAGSGCQGSIVTSPSTCRTG